MHPQARACWDLNPPKLVGKSSARVYWFSQPEMEHWRIFCRGSSCACLVTGSHKKEPFHHRDNRCPLLAKENKQKNFPSGRLRTSAGAAQGRAHARMLAPCGPWHQRLQVFFPLILIYLRALGGSIKTVEEPR